MTASSTAIVDGIKTTTQTVTKTLADGTTEQQQVITQTQDKVIDGAIRTVETVKTDVYKRQPLDWDKKVQVERYE